MLPLHPQPSYCYAAESYLCLYIVIGVGRISDWNGCAQQCYVLNSLCSDKPGHWKMLSNCLFSDHRLQANVQTLHGQEKLWPQHVHDGFSDHGPFQCSPILEFLRGNKKQNTLTKQITPTAERCVIWKSCEDVGDILRITMDIYITDRYFLVSMPLIRWNKCCFISHWHCELSYSVKTWCVCCGGE